MCSQLPIDNTLFSIDNNIIKKKNIICKLQEMFQEKKISLDKIKSLDPALLPLAKVFLFLQENDFTLFNANWYYQDTPYEENSNIDLSYELLIKQKFYYYSIFNNNEFITYFKEKGFFEFERKISVLEFINFLCKSINNDDKKYLISLLNFFKENIQITATTSHYFDMYAQNFKNDNNYDQNLFEINDKKISKIAKTIKKEKVYSTETIYNILDKYLNFNIDNKNLKLKDIKPVFLHEIKDMFCLNDSFLETQNKDNVNFLDYLKDFKQNSFDNFIIFKKDWLNRNSISQEDKRYSNDKDLKKYLYKKSIKIQ